jgi:nitroreductase
MPLGQAIYSLRAIRRVRPDPIADEDLQIILDAAIHAPNGGNAQPWRFLVLQDPDLRARFAELYREAWWAKRRDQGIMGPQDIPPHDRVAQAAMRLADEFGTAPVVIVVCATARGAGAMGSVIPSVQNLLLAARALGLGANITTWHMFLEHEWKKELGIPRDVHTYAVIPVGWPRGRFGPVTRRPAREAIHWDRW